MYYMLRIGNINVCFASKFLVNLYINMFIWRRLGGCLIRIGVRKGVARLASPYRLTAFKTLMHIVMFCTIMETSSKEHLLATGKKDASSGKRGEIQMELRCFLSRL